MKISGIVAEYNPFHNGHFYQLEETKKITGCDFTIAVMSGNFAQRGAPCLIDKYTRTKMALASGIDMVLELPFPFATASAERFCEAAVSIFHKSGIINTISFGSEIGDVNLLTEVAKILLNEPQSVSLSIKQSLKQGISYPRARAQAICEFLQDTILSDSQIPSMISALSSPNNILGIHYIKALLKFDSSISPLTIKREYAAYHDTEIKHCIASATAIRNQMSQNNLSVISSTMPKASFDFLFEKHTDDLPLITLDYFTELFQYKLSFSCIEELYTLWDIPLNLLNSIYRAAQTHFTISEIVKVCTSKTYTKATVQRAILRILLGLTSLDMNALSLIDWIPYIRVLGCRKSATPLLSHLSTSSAVPVITNLGRQYKILDSLSQMLLNYEQKASCLYHLAEHKSFKYHSDLSTSLIVL